MACDRGRFRDRGGVVDFLDTAGARGYTSEENGTEERLVASAGLRQTQIIDILRGCGLVLLAPVRFCAAMFNGAFRTGLFFLFKLPVALGGLLLLCCWAVVAISIVQGLHAYNADPKLQLQSAETALAWTLQSEREEAEYRRARGLSPVALQEARIRELQAKVARLREEVAAKAQRGARASGRM